MTITFLNSWQTKALSQRRRWTNQEIADFHRAVNILKQAGLNTDVDSGVTDEGDPWFVFIRPENGDVIAIRQQMMVSHSYDHRIINGAMGGMFLLRLKQRIENWDETQTI